MEKPSIRCSTMFSIVFLIIFLAITFVSTSYVFFNFSILSFTYTLRLLILEKIKQGMSSSILFGMATREELIELYVDKMGASLDNFEFYYCFGLFRLAVIAQQIYYRFYHGQTKDKRFQYLIFGVQLLEQAASKIVEAN